MPLPASNKAINRMGRSLADGNQILDADADLWLEVLIAYDLAVQAVGNRLDALGLASTGRVKETPTLAEKLGRQPGMQMLNLDDVGGVRIVTDGGLSAQNLTLAMVLEELGSELVKKPIDRRESPSHGYRAVHVVVRSLDGLRVEIQIRTELQDLWAQVIEALGTKWGRELRYGEPIRHGGLSVFPGAGQSRNEFYAFCRRFADDIAGHEELDLESDELRAAMTNEGELSYLLRPQMAVRRMSLRFRLGRVERRIGRARSSIRALLEQLISLANMMEVGP